MLGRNYGIRVEPLSERDVIGKDAKGEINVSIRAQHNNSFNRSANSTAFMRETPLFSRFVAPG
jgi:hypothetical protein